MQVRLQAAFSFVAMTTSESRSAQRPRTVRPTHWIAAPVTHLQGLIVLAVMLGGGGVGYGLRNLVIQLAALAILAWHYDRVQQFFRKGPRVLAILVVLSLALPLIQLVPLPPPFWQSLPGRDIVVQSFAIAGIDPASWFPVSLDRARTLVAFTGMLAPAAIIAIGVTLTRAQQLRLVWTLGVAALGALLLGVAQVSLGNSAGLLFPVQPKSGVIYATFANRNSTGLFFVIAAILLAAIPLPRAREWLVGVTAAGSLLLLGAVLTQSRSALALVVLALAFVALRLGYAWWQARRGPARVVNPAVIVATGFGLLVGGIAVASLASGGRAAETFERFANLENDRLTMWEDGLYAAEQFWPAGSGMGTFDEVYQVYESLEYVTLRRAGRMHNDYLEVALEAGAAGLALIAAWLAWCAWSSLIGRRGEDRWIALGAGFGIAAIALQSLLDYPLRNQTMLCVAALLIVLLARPKRVPR